MTATKPGHVFRDGDMPETATLKIHRPRAFAHLTKEEWAEKVRTSVQAKDAEARERRLEKGKNVLFTQNPSAPPSPSGVGRCRFRFSRF